MKKIVFAALIAALAATSYAQSKIPARSISIPDAVPDVTILTPTNRTLYGLYNWLEAYWPTNINRSTAYATSNQVVSMIGGAAMPGTNIANGTYNPVDKTWTIAGLLQTNEYYQITSNITQITQYYTNIAVSQFQTILTNGAPMMVDYLNLSNSVTEWTYHGTTNWNGVSNRAVTTWVEIPEPGSVDGKEIGFDSTNGIVTIPANCLAISYFRGRLKDSYFDSPGSYSTSVDFMYAGTNDFSSQGVIFSANKEDDGDPVDIVRSGDTRFFSPIPTERRMRLVVRHSHSSIPYREKSATKDHAQSWQVLLIRFL
jgi:hypothetical protein